MSEEKEDYYHFCYLPNRWNEELECSKGKSFAEPECKGCKYYRVVKMTESEVWKRQFHFSRMCKYEEDRLEFDILLWFIAFMLRFFKR